MVILLAGVVLDGCLGDGITEQTAIVYRNIVTILEQCGKRIEKPVKMTIYLTNLDYIDAWRTEQKMAFGDFVPASTLSIVNRLARAEFLVEVEVEAIVAKD